MRWAHLLCAIWIPEVSLGNTTFMEPVQDVEKVPKTRWRLVSCMAMTLCVQILKHPEDLLHLQAKNGCMYTMRQQSMLRGVPRYVREKRETLLKNEIVSWHTG